MPTDPSPVVRVRRDGHCATVTLDRPHVLNALNVELVRQLRDALIQVQDARAIVLQGAGSAFCSGQDLKQTLNPATGSAEELRRSLEWLQDIARLIAGSRAIVISVVQGYAVGGGAEIALAADFVIAGPAARVKFPEVEIGHAQTGGITARLPAMVGLLRAKELLLTGRWVGAIEGHTIGLFTEISEDPFRRAQELAALFARTGSPAAATAKASLESAALAMIEPVLRSELDSASYCFNAPEAAGAFSDFAARSRGL